MAGAALSHRGRRSTFAKYGTDFAAGAALSQGQVQISWQAQCLRKVRYRFCFRCRTFAGFGTDSPPHDVRRIDDSTKVMMTEEVFSAAPPPHDARRSDDSTKGDDDRRSDDSARVR